VREAKAGVTGKTADAAPDFCMAAGFFFSHHPSYRTLTLVGTGTG
jgi:hypothetical protein